MSKNEATKKSTSTKAKQVSEPKRAKARPKPTRRQDAPLLMKQGSKAIAAATSAKLPSLKKASEGKSAAKKGSSAPQSNKVQAKATQTAKTGASAKKTAKDAQQGQELKHLRTIEAAPEPVPDTTPAARERLQKRRKAAEPSQKSFSLSSIPKALAGVCMGAAQALLSIRLTPEQLKFLGKVGLVLVLVFAMLYGPARAFYAARRDEDRLRAHLAQIKENSAEIQAQIQKLTTREGIEDEARKRGYVGAGETAVQISEPAAEHNSATTSANSGQDQAPEQGSQGASAQQNTSSQGSGQSQNKQDAQGTNGQSESQKPKAEEEQDLNYGKTGLVEHRGPLTVVLDFVFFYTPAPLPN